VSEKAVVTFSFALQSKDVMAKLSGLAAIHLRDMAPMQLDELVMPETTTKWQEGYGVRV